MGKGNHYPRVLPTGGLESPRDIGPRDRLQKPRSPVYVVEEVENLVYGVFLTGHFEISGQRKEMYILADRDLSEWGWER